MDDGLDMSATESLHGNVMDKIESPHKVKKVQNDTTMLVLQVAVANR